MHWHFVNDTRKTEDPNERLGWIGKAGRFFLKYGEDRRLAYKEAEVRIHTEYRHSLKIEWRLCQSNCQISFEAGEEEGPEVTFSIGLPLLLTLYVRHSVPGWFLKKILPSRTVKSAVNMNKEFTYLLPRRFDIYFYGWALWWQFWVHTDEWTSDIPRWRSGSFHFLDALFGQRDCQTEYLSQWEDWNIGMLEGVYPVKIQTQRRTWTRKRWPFWPSWMERVTREVECEMGIPFPGKGENSWDCGEGGLFAAGFEVLSNESACQEFANCVLEYRRKYGGQKCAEEPWPESPVDRAARILQARMENAEQLAQGKTNS